MPFALREIDIEVNGKNARFEVYENDIEYEVDRSRPKDTVITSDCIKALG